MLDFFPVSLKLNEKKIAHMEFGQFRMQISVQLKPRAPAHTPKLLNNNLIFEHESICIVRGFN